MPTAIEQLPVSRKRRPRFWIVTLHVLKSAVLLPLLVKYLLFVLLALTTPPLPIALLLWIVGSLAVYRFTVRRSLASIRRKLTCVSPERCIIPSMIAFGGFALFNFLIDVALATNSGSNPGGLILLSVGLCFAIFVYQSLATLRGFAAMPEASRELPITTTDFLVGISDIAVVAGFLIFLLAAILVSF